jgi:putative transposase
MRYLKLSIHSVSAREPRPRAASIAGWCQGKFSAVPAVLASGMSNPFRYFNSSPEVIRLVVMMYAQYPLSLRNVEDLLAERGIDISHETVRFWWNRFGPMFAAEIRKRRVAHMRAYPQWRWHLDEVFVKVNGKLCYLWRAVDHEGEVLEAVATMKRDKAAALKLLKRIMKKYGAPRSIVTDGLRAYSAAMNEIGVAAERHEVGGRLNNRAENSHQPFRRRERAMQRFRSLKTLQKFSSVHAQVHNQFNQERHLVTRQVYKQRRSAALAEWRALVA